jgi:hypothetical protein
MVIYRFTLGHGESIQFEVNRRRCFVPQGDQAPHASWTELAYHRCSHCALSPAAHRYCPVALDLEPIAAQFKHVISYTKARVDVLAPERQYAKECDVQTGLRSLLGLVMATSACPILAPFRALAASHLPFATLEETLFRTVGAYLLRQYFVYQAGGTPDLDLRGLHQFYQNLHDLNRCFTNRLVAASEQDANLNALYSLLCVAEGVSFSLDDHLQELRQVFLGGQ